MTDQELNEVTSELLSRVENREGGMFTIKKLMKMAKMHCNDDSQCADGGANMVLIVLLITQRGGGVGVGYMVTT